MPPAHLLSFLPSRSLRLASPLKPISQAVRATLFGMALAAASVPFNSFAAGPQSLDAVSSQPYSIPAGPLGRTLVSFAVNAGIALSFDPMLTEGLTSPALSGSYSAREAVTRLLAGSGLDMVVRTDGSYTLRKTPTNPSTQPKVEEAAPAKEAVLPVVTVLGSRAPGAALSSVPHSITVLKEPTVQRDLSSGARIEDILTRNVPGVHPANVGVRTIRGRTAQVFVNGAPMNEQMRFGSGSDLNTISPDHLAAVEVSRGANAAYGFGSPGGIIALSTPQAESEKLALTTRLRTSFNTSHRSGSHQTTAYQSAAQIVGDFDYHVAFSTTRDGTNYTPDGQVANLFTSPGLFKNGDEKIHNFDANLGYDLGRAGRVRFITTGQYIDYLKYYDIDGGVYRETDATATEVPDAGLSYRRARTFNLSYENDEVAGSALKLEAFGSHVNASRHEADDVWYQEMNDYLGLRSALTTALPTLGQSAAVTYGLDFIRNDMGGPRRATSTGALTGIGGPEATLDMLAPYAQLNLPLGRTKLNAGVRHERYSGRVESTSNGSWDPVDDGPGGKFRDFSVTLFNAGVLHPLDASNDLHANYTQGGEVSQIRRSAFVVNDPSRIDPQATRSHQIETGLRHRGHGFNTTVTAFYSYSKLMSATDCSDPTMPCVPLREPRKIWGLEFSGDWKMNRQWTLAGSFTWHDGRRKAQGSEQWTDMSSVDVAPAHGSVSLAYAPTQTWRNSLIVDWRGGRGRISDGWPYGQVDAATLLHLSTAVDVGTGTVEFGVHNLLNKTVYALQAGAYNGGWAWLPEQGRRVSLGYNVKW